MTLSVGRLARRFGLSRATLLYYDRIGLLSPSSRSRAGYRLYGPAEVERLAAICRYRQVGLSLAQVEALLAGEASRARAILRERLDQLSAEIEALRGQQQTILRLLAGPGLPPRGRVLDKERWVAWVQAADVLLVNGGDSMYLCYWMRKSGLADLLPSLDIVWVGLSAGSMIMTPRIGEEFVGWQPPADDKEAQRGDETLGFVDFALFPHLEHEMLPWNTMANAEKWAAKLDCPAYAIDDETAFKVVDGAVEVISEGQWQQLSSVSQR